MHGLAQRKEDDNECVGTTCVCTQKPFVILFLCLFIRLHSHRSCSSSSPLPAVAWYSTYGKWIYCDLCVCVRVLLHRRRWQYNENDLHILFPLYAFCCCDVADATQATGSTTTTTTTQHITTGDSYSKTFHYIFYSLFAVPRVFSIDFREKCARYMDWIGLMYTSVYVFTDGNIYVLTEHFSRTTSCIVQEQRREWCYAKSSGSQTRWNITARVALYMEREGGDDDEGVCTWYFQQLQL